MPTVLAKRLRSMHAQLRSIRHTKPCPRLTLVSSCSSGKSDPPSAINVVSCCISYRCDVWQCTSKALLTSLTGVCRLTDAAVADRATIGNALLVTVARLDAGRDGTLEVGVARADKT